MPRFQRTLHNTRDWVVADSGILYPSSMLPQVSYGLHWSWNQATLARRYSMNLSRIYAFCCLEVDSGEAEARHIEPQGGLK